MNILIIEDEIKTAKELRKLIEGLDDSIKVLDILPSVKSSVQWLSTQPAPDLIFSDIQLADGLSFDIYKTIDVNVPVIFCTAFDEYAIQAFEANSIDYLLKPVDEERLAQSIEKYKRLRQFFDPANSPYTKALSNLTGQMDPSFKKTILVYVREKIIPVRTEDIAFFHATNGMVNLETRQEHKYATSYNMDQLETMLDAHRFFRVNRQFIINRDVIQNVEHYFNRRLFLRLTCATPENIIISKLKATEFLQWMES